MTVGRDSLSRSESVMVAAIEEGIPALVDAPGIIADFHFMVRKKAASQLPSWLDRACQSLVTSFGSTPTLKYLPWYQRAR